VWIVSACEKFCLALLLLLEKVGPHGVEIVSAAGMSCARGQEMLANERPVHGGFGAQPLLVERGGFPVPCEPHPATTKTLDDPSTIRAHAGRGYELVNRTQRNKDY
jgi:hypothetical protein